MTTIKDIFSDFYRLSYKDSPSTFTQGFNDYFISTYIILRKCESGDYIYYLTTGSSIYIPIDWINIFSALEVYDGNRILKGYYQNSDDKISELCYLMTNLIYLINSLVVKKTGNDILNTLEKICVIGTGDFRNWVVKEFNLILPQFEYRSLEEDIIKI